MPKLYDRLRVVATANGVGTFSIGAAAADEWWRTPAAAGVTSGEQVYYVAKQGTAGEEGYGTVTSGSPWTWSRDVVIASSNGGAKVNFTAGQDIDLYCAAPAEATQNTVRAVASGTVSNGAIAVINTDGTVSVTGILAASAGSPAVFESAWTDFCAACYDAVAGKVVVAYQDIGNSSYGTAVVGTVSGTSISFGTPVVFRTAGCHDIAATFDVSTGKVVIAYRDSGSSNNGMAVVGTVSGTSINFGTPVAFNAAATYSISACYDRNAAKVVIAYANGGGSSYGTVKVGTVSGTSISFGSAVIFESVATAYVAACYDSAAGRVVIAYQNSTTTNGRAVVGTVSGTSISFGTPVGFGGISDIRSISACFHPVAGRIVIAFWDSSYQYGKVISGAVSGTSVSFNGSPYSFDSGSSFSVISVCYDELADRVVVAWRDEGNANYGSVVTAVLSGDAFSFPGAVVIFEFAITSCIAAVYVPAAGKSVFAYRDEGNSGYGTATVYTAPIVNATTENILGVVQKAAANGQQCVVGSSGFLDEQQAGLTPGRKYYIANDGSLTLTNTGRYIGKAVAATKLLVGG